MENINIIAHDNCTGCSACLQVCPKKCISLKTKEFGFTYPFADESVCINCKKCLKVCPAFNCLPARKPLKCFGGYNKNENLRYKSSSGGVFIELASYVIDQGGVVFGVVFDKDWNVIHSHTDTKDGLLPMLGSKYVQSEVRYTFQECKSYLDENRLVLYSGTPCQVAGLNNYLSKQYDNLITVDVVCHGVPGPGIWRDYLTLKIKDSKNIHDINFRDKCTGWETFSLTFSYDDNRKNTDSILNDIYLKGFLSDLYLRKSCYHCPTREFRSGSDITIGDYWGYKKTNLKFPCPEKGLSIVSINSKKAIGIINNLQSLILYNINYDEMIDSNPNLICASKEDEFITSRFLKKYKKGNLSYAINATTNMPFFLRVLHKLYVFLNR